MAIFREHDSAVLTEGGEVYISALYSTYEADQKTNIIVSKMP
jgi:hypothetical protein